MVEEWMILDAKYWRVLTNKWPTPCLETCLKKTPKLKRCFDALANVLTVSMRVGTVNPETVSSINWWTN